MAWIPHKWKRRVDILWTLTDYLWKWRLCIHVLRSLIPGAMKIKSDPLVLIYFHWQATCPARDQKSLSPSDICKKTDERLSERDMTPEGGCSKAFRDSLSKFLKVKCVENLEKTIESLKPREEDHNSSFKNISSNISGITSRQLEVKSDTKCSFLIFILQFNYLNTFLCIVTGHPLALLTFQCAHYFSKLFIVAIIINWYHHDAVIIRSLATARTCVLASKLEESLSELSSSAQKNCLCLGDFGILTIISIVWFIFGLHHTQNFVWTVTNCSKNLTLCVQIFVSSDWVKYGSCSLAFACSSEQSM